MEGQPLGLGRGVQGGADMTVEMSRGATISKCGLYRYDLTRWWDITKPKVGFVMLNPSTADGEKDDPTIVRCIDFARRWGYGGLGVYNLFAHRATDPNDLLTAADPFGPQSDEYLERAAQLPLVVCAWGSWGQRGADLMFAARGFRVATSILREAPLHTLAINQDGCPRHPLYMRASTMPKPWPLEERGKPWATTYLTHQT